ncbi:MAG: glycosyl hydrolase family 59, partial [Oscillospiraceae bacterium]|nr:glycosyl hydrolase family 59 [Oscillospiraceae bacterium]
MSKEIILDGSQVSTREVFRGLGCVTGSGSSRLLMDYKRKHPEIYQEIMKLLFQPDYGASLIHIKIELGADVNSFSGTEPCAKRFLEEKTNVTRGASFQFAADAKKLNPEITLDLLRWGEPHWVTEAFQESKKAGFEARYRWYYETLKAAYETYHLKFDFISPDSNEPDVPDAEWLIYFSKRLKSERHAPYDFSQIKIVASDEITTQNISALMRENELLRNAVNVISLHHTTKADENTKYLHDFYEKEIWYSEGIAPCNVPEFSRRADGTGITGSNGAVNTAVRIINAYAKSRMNLYEFQPPVSAHY